MKYNWMLNQKLALVVSIMMILYILPSVLLHYGQTKLIFRTDNQLKSTPQKYGLSYQDVWLNVSDDKVHAWWIPHDDKSAPTIIYFHGNSSNNGDVVNIAQIFNRLGMSVLLVDYRGYGKSSPTHPNETRVYEDAIATWSYLTQERQIAPKKIFVYGHSLGGAIAIELASQHPEMAGVITEGTFTSMLNIVSYNKALRIFPLNWILTQRFDSITKIKSLKTPILIIHGTADEIIPVEMAAELFATAPQSKQLAIIPQAGHNNLQEVGGEEYVQQVQQFILTHSAIGDQSL